jgi:hypothetical protein
MEFIGPVSEPDAPRPPIFGPVVAVPDDASAMDRFVGLTGRDPEWQPGWQPQQR